MRSASLATCNRFAAQHPARVRSENAYTRALTINLGTGPQAYGEELKREGSNSPNPVGSTNTADRVGPSGDVSNGTSKSP
jgi:hypothetical protein